MAKFFFVLILFSAKDGVINYQPTAFLLPSLLILLTSQERPFLPTTFSLSLPPSYFVSLWFSSSLGGDCSNENLLPAFKRNVILFSRQLENEWHCSLLRQLYRNRHLWNWQYYLEKKPVMLWKLFPPFCKSCCCLKKQTNKQVEKNLHLVQSNTVSNPVIFSLKHSFANQSFK